MGELIGSDVLSNIWNENLTPNFIIEVMNNLVAKLFLIANLTCSPVLLVTCTCNAINASSSGSVLPIPKGLFDTLPVFLKVEPFLLDDDDLVFPISQENELTPEYAEPPTEIESLTPPPAQSRPSSLVGFEVDQTKTEISTPLVEPRSLEPTVQFDSNADIPEIDIGKWNSTTNAAEFTSDSSLGQPEDQNLRSDHDYEQSNSVRNTTEYEISNLKDRIQLDHEFEVNNAVNEDAISDAEQETAPRKEDLPDEIDLLLDVESPPFLKPFVAQFEPNKNPILEIEELQSATVQSNSIVDQTILKSNDNWIFIWSLWGVLSLIAISITTWILHFLITRVFRRGSSRQVWPKVDSTQPVRGEFKKITRRKNVRKESTEVGTAGESSVDSQAFACCAKATTNSQYPPLTLSAFQIQKGREMVNEFSPEEESNSSSGFRSSPDAEEVRAPKKSDEAVEPIPGLNNETLSDSDEEWEFDFSADDDFITDSELELDGLFDPQPTLAEELNQIDSPDHALTSKPAFQFPDLTDLSQVKEDSKERRLSQSPHEADSDKLPSPSSVPKAASSPVKRVSFWSRIFGIKKLKQTEETVNILQKDNSDIAIDSEIRVPNLSPRVSNEEKIDKAKVKNRVVLGREDLSGLFQELPTLQDEEEIPSEKQDSENEGEPNTDFSYRSEDSSDQDTFVFQDELDQLPQGVEMDAASESIENLPSLHSLPSLDTLTSLESLTSLDSTNSLVDELNENANSAISEPFQTIGEFEQRIVELRQVQDTAMKTIENLNLSLSATQAKLQAAYSENESLVERLGEAQKLEHQLAELQKSQTKANETIDHLESIVSASKEDLEAVQSENETLVERLSKLQSIENRFTDLQQVLTKASQTNENLELSLSATQEELQAKQSENQTLFDRLSYLNSLESRLAELDQTHLNDSQTIEALRNENELIGRELHALRQENTKLGDKLSKLQKQLELHSGCGGQGGDFSQSAESAATALIATREVKEKFTRLYKAYEKERACRKRSESQVTDLQEKCLQMQQSLENLKNEIAAKLPSHD